MGRFKLAIILLVIGLPLAVIDAVGQEWGLSGVLIFVGSIVSIVVVRYRKKLGILTKKEKQNRDELNQISHQLYEEWFQLNKLRKEGKITPEQKARFEFLGGDYISAYSKHGELAREIYNQRKEQETTEPKKD